MAAWPPRIEKSSGALIVDLGGEWLVASTGVDGGLRRARYIVVARSEGGDPWREASKALEELGLEKDRAVTLLTAVDPSKARSAWGEEAFAAVTVGLSSPSCIGGERFEAPKLSTINVVAVVKRPLTEAGLLDLLRTVAEAKTAAARDLGLWCGDAGPPLGTVSDAIAVAAPLEGDGLLPWSGAGTVHGGEAAELVYRLVLEGDERSMEERLAGLIGVGLDSLVADAVRAYSSAPVPGVEASEFAGMIREILEQALRDQNVWTLLAAARGAHDYLKASLKEYTGDPRGLIADELIGSMIALYINGWRGLLAAYWLDRRKKDLGLGIAGLPPMLDDAAAGLLGGAYSRLLDDIVGGLTWRRQR